MHASVVSQTFSRILDPLSVISVKFYADMRYKRKPSFVNPAFWLRLAELGDLQSDYEYLGALERVVLLYGSLCMCICVWCYFYSTLSLKRCKRHDVRRQFKNISCARELLSLVVMHLAVICGPVRSFVHDVLLTDYGLAATVRSTQAEIQT